MFERFTEQAMQAVMNAQEQARSFGHNWVGTEHLLVGLTQLKRTMAEQVLSTHVRVSALRNALKEARPRVAAVNQMELPFSKNAKSSFETAWYKSAERLELITTAHVLAGLCSIADSTAYRMLKKVGCDPAHIEELALQRISLSERIHSIHVPLTERILIFAGVRSQPLLEAIELPQHLIKPSLNATASKLMQTRKFTQAERLLIEALEFNPNTDRGGHAITLSSLGYIHLERGEFDKAETMFRHALDLRRDLQMEASAPHTVALALNNLGFAVHWQRRFREACKYYQQALDLIFEQDRPEVEAILLNNFGDAERGLKNYERARELLIDSEGPPYNNENYIMYRHLYKARLYADTKDFDSAEKEFIACMEMADPLTDPAHIKIVARTEYANLLQSKTQ